MGSRALARAEVGCRTRSGPARSRLASVVHRPAGSSARHLPKFGPVAVSSYHQGADECEPGDRTRSPQFGLPSARKMPQAEDRARLETRPWAGTMDQLTRAARRASERVAEAFPFPEGFDPDPTAGQMSTEEGRAKYEVQRAAERARRVEISLLEADGFQRTLTAITDLDDIPDQDVGRIDVLDIEIGGSGYSPTSVSIEVSRFRGLEVKIAGKHRGWTAGLRHELQDILKPRYRLRPPLVTDDDVYIMIALPLCFVLFIGLTSLFAGVAHWSSGGGGRDRLGYCIARCAFRGLLRVVADVGDPAKRSAAEISALEAGDPGSDGRVGDQPRGLGHCCGGSHRRIN